MRVSTCPNCNQSYPSTTSAQCPICNQLESLHIENTNWIECPRCIICKGVSDYGGERIGYPSKYADGEYICADCLATLVDEAIEDLKVARKS